MTTLTHHPGLTNEAYHALKAVSPSQIKVLGRSPLHYFDQFLAEDRRVRPVHDIHTYERLDYRSSAD